MDIILILLLILLNGLLSMSEIAVVSVRRARLQAWAKSGDQKARAALDLVNSPNQFLSTVQVGITLIGVLLGAVGEAALAQHLTTYLQQFPRLAPYSNAIALSVVVITLTYLSLIIGELVPKRLGLQGSERIARQIAFPMRAFARFAHPAVRLLSASTDLVLRALRVPPPTPPTVTEEEIKVLIEEGAQTGVFLQAERDLLRNVIRLADRPIETLMQPRGDVVWLDLDDSLETNLKKMTESPHSRLPVVRGGVDNVLGMVLAKDLLARILTSKTVDIAAAMRPALHVPETLSPLRLLEMFKSAGTDIAIIVDEYGETKGLATLNDVLAAIAGDLVPGTEAGEPRIVRREDGSLLLDGMLGVDELKDLLQIPRLPDEEEAHYETLGGFVLAHLGRIPAIADHFEWDRYRFEIVDMDGNRIDRVLVAPLAPEQNPDSDGA